MCIEREIGELLKEKGLRLAVAETTAGGLISSRLVSVPGSSRYFEGGVVAYSKGMKTELLGIPEDTLSQHGAVSLESAGVLAEAVRNITGADIGLSETGIAGPIRGRSPKPIGTACLAVSSARGTEVVEKVLEGDRTEIREGIAEEALQFLAEYLKVRK